VRELSWRDCVGVCGRVSLLLLTFLPWLAHLPPLRASQIPFDSDLQISDAVQGAVSVFWVDIDSDGDVDLITASLTDDTIAWQENVIGDGSLWAFHIVDDLVDGAWSVHAADVDGDGDADILGTAFFGSTVSWYENVSGDGSSWEKHIIRDIDPRPTAVFGADVDGDGDIDVISAAIVFDTVSWHENVAGDGSIWLTRLMRAGVEDPQSIHAGDIDHDGDLDVAVAYSKGNTVAWLENQDGLGNIWGFFQVTGSALFAQSVHLRDIDGDNDLDIIQASANDNGIAWFENSGVPFFWEFHLISGSLGAPSGIFAADLDGDGDVDVLSAASGSDAVTFHENLFGDGLTWAPGAITTGANEARAVGAADLDGDGDLDPFAVALAQDGIKWHRNASIHRSALFPASMQIPTSLSASTLVITEDLDGNGTVDVLIVSPDENRIVLHSNVQGDMSLWSEVTVSTALSPSSAFVGDVNGDGIQDVISASAGEDSVLWHENVGGQWLRRSIATDALDASFVAGGDVDGDGDLDIIVGSAGGSPLAWYENEFGNGSSWSEHALPTVRPRASAILVADMDADGDADVLAAFSEDNLIAWHENLQGDGLTWGAALISATAQEVESLAVTDMDHDGDLDVVSASPGADRLVWHENLDGSGVAWVENIVADDVPMVRSVSVVDLDGDGDPDLLAAAPGGDGILWHQNLGDGFAWTQHGTGEGAPGVQSVMSADLDGDGRLDLVAVSPGDGTLTFHPNRGGQYRLITTDIAPAAPFEGGVEALLRIRVEHLGRPLDGPLQLASLALLLDDGQGNPLDEAQAASLLQDLEIYLDDGSGTFEVHRDTRLASAGLAEGAAGEQEVTFVQNDPLVQVSHGLPRDFFVVARFAPGAAAQSPNSLRVTHRASAGVGTQDLRLNIPLTQEHSPEVASSAMVIGVDADADGYSDLVDCDDGNPAAFPDAIEVCDGVDNDCSGELDEDCSPGAEPAVALCAGMAHHVWTDTSATGSRIRHRRCAVGALSCSPPVILASTTTPSVAPSATCSGSTVLVVWEDRRSGGNANIAFRRSVDGGMTFEPLRFVVRGPGEETRPGVALSGEVALVVWEDCRLGNRDVAMRRSLDGGATWGTVQFLVRGVLDELAPSVALDGDVALLAWVDRRHGSDDIAYRRSIDSGGSWLPLRFLARGPAAELSPSVALEGSLALVGWVDNRTGNSDLAFRRSTDAGSSFTEMSFLVRAPSEDTGISMRLGGMDALVSWVDRKQGNQDVSVRHSLDGGATWGMATRLVSSPSDESLPTCDVSVNLASCSWIDARTSELSLHARESADGGETWLRRFALD